MHEKGSLTIDPPSATPPQALLASHGEHAGWSRYCGAGSRGAGKRGAMSGCSVGRDAFFFSPSFPANYPSLSLPHPPLSFPLIPYSLLLPLLSSPRLSSPSSPLLPSYPAQWRKFTAPKVATTGSEHFSNGWALGLKIRVPYWAPLHTSGHNVAASNCQNGGAGGLKTTLHSRSHWSKAGDHVAVRDFQVTMRARD